MAPLDAARLDGNKDAVSLLKELGAPPTDLERQEEEARARKLEASKSLEEKVKPSKLKLARAKIASDKRRAKMMSRIKTRLDLEMEDARRIGLGEAKHFAEELRKEVQRLVVGSAACFTSEQSSPNA